MRFTPTKTTATLAGVWCALGMSLADTWSQPIQQSAIREYIAGAILVFLFFYAPIVVFVVGTRHVRFGIGHLFTAEYWREYRREFPQLSLRMLLWFMSAVATGVAYAYFVYGEWPS